MIDFDTNATVRAIHDNVETLPARIYRQLNLAHDELLPPVPPALDERYRQALNIAPPPAYNGLEHFPLAEGLDALMAAYEASTVRSPASRSSLRIWTPSMEEMNNLIKARWIFDRIRESSLLRSSSPDSIWAYALETALKSLQDEYGRCQQVLDQNFQAIAALNPEFFRIWLPTEKSVEQLITDPNESQTEDKILEASLQSSREQFKKDLIVFRRPGNEFRVLKYTSQNSSGGDTTIHDENKVLNIHSTQIIPRYALPPYGQNLSDTCDFELCFPGASSGDLYRFSNEDDRYAFQQALLGYKVVFEDTCCWRLHRRRLKSQVQGTGLVQIFQPKALQHSNRSQMDHSPGSHSLNCNDSMVSHATALTAVSRASTQLYASRSNESIIAEYPHAPLIVIFTKIDGQLTFLRIACKYFCPTSQDITHTEAVTHDVHVMPKRCDCGSDNKLKKDKCHFTVLESSLKFPMHRFSAPSESKWNLAFLCLPKHPEFDKRMENVEHINYLCIETFFLGKGHRALRFSQDRG